MKNPSSYVKAIVAGLIAGLSTLGAFLSQGSLTAVVVISAVVAALTAFGAVFAAPNAPQ